MNSYGSVPPSGARNRPHHSFQTRNFVISGLGIIVGTVALLNIVWSVPRLPFVLEDDTDSAPQPDALPPAVQDLMTLVNMDDKRTWYLLYL